ncbi:MAG: glyoxalase/bleomycin resistance/extradiol dioxygenase family protein [Chloroflexi bacterium]|nr:MAG: glyoxalase/bleomycin resistance/extradiol dioxygenase family protein [Chloroflexota bacterium]
MPDVIPMLAYENGVEALEWLVRVFGFRERERWLGEDGLLAHGELDAGDGLIMLATPTPDYESPKHHRQTCEPARRWSQVPWVIDGVLVYVDDVDQHYERARRAGAVILTEPEDGPPGRRYRAEDLEGHRWMFMERGAG